MHEIDDETRRGVLGEALFEELRAIRELVSDVPEISRTVKSLDERLTEVEIDIKTIKIVVTDHSRILKRHEQQLAKL